VSDIELRAALQNLYDAVLVTQDTWCIVGCKASVEEWVRLPNGKFSRENIHHWDRHEKGCPLLAAHRLLASDAQPGAPS
jgi:hypothetical protein